MVNNDPANLPPQVDISADRAKTDFVLFMPGVTASLLVFIVFGTTRAFRDYTWKTLVPRSLRAKMKTHRTRKMTPSVVTRASQMPQQADGSQPWPLQSPPAMSYHAYTIGEAESGNYTPLSNLFTDIGLQDMGQSGKVRVGIQEDERPILGMRKIMPGQHRM